MARIVVAIDGPAGAGKSTASRKLAETLGYAFLDTGAIYRTLALAARRDGVSWDDEPRLAALADGLAVRFTPQAGVNRVYLASDDVTAAIRTPDVSDGASRVSTWPVVRAALLDLQRRLGRGGGVVAEGRDTGTVVFPNAEAKIFLTASLDERARRRAAELGAAGHAVDLPSLRSEIETRDLRDSTRATAPLRAAGDAELVDTTGLSLDQVVARLAAVARARGA